MFQLLPDAQTASRKTKNLYIALSSIVFFAGFSFFSSSVAASAAAIRYPLPTRPAIIEAGACFDAETEGNGTENDFIANLTSQKYNVPLIAKNARYSRERRSWLVELCVPDGAREELYSLTVLSSGAEATSRRAVKVIPRFKTEYDFVHMTDVHIGCCKKTDQYSKERTPDPSPEDGFAQIIEEVNRLHPEFVLITGDIAASAEAVSRIEGRVEGTVAEKEFNDFLTLLDRFEAPTFIVPGNHDMAGIHNKPLLNYWKRTFIWRYYSFLYGNDYYLGMDNSNAMEGLMFVYKRASYEFDDEQKQWLIKDLEQNVSSPLKVFFFHVNTNRKQIDDLADKYGAQLALFGHWHKDEVKTSGRTPTIWVQTKSTLDFLGYRVIHVKDHAIAGYAVDENGSSIKAIMQEK